MGLFTSNCKKCYSHITWFLVAPQNYKCRHCGEYNSPREIEDSWHYNYMIYHQLCKFNSKEEAKLKFKDDPIALYEIERMYWK